MNSVEILFKLLMNYISKVNLSERVIKMWRNIFCQNYNNKKTKTFCYETEPASVNFYFLYFRMEQNCSTAEWLHGTFIIEMDVHNKNTSFLTIRLF